MVAEEAWQGHRMEIADLDADGDLDVVLLAGEGLRELGTDTVSAHDRPALRVLRNDHPASPNHLVDVSATSFPPIDPSTDRDLRGTALAIGDVNGDGHLDIVIGTTEVLRNPDGSRRPSVRLLLGDGALGFTEVERAFGEAGEELVADDIVLTHGATEGVVRIIIVTEDLNSAASREGPLRIFDWAR